jgi:cyclic pyranopterin phosphate synthase
MSQLLLAAFFPEFTMIVDRQGRRFRNLRISLTAACNYACTYCVPDGKRLVAAQNELSADQMARGVEFLIEAAGIERLRITGGEPLLSPRLEGFMEQVGKMGLGDISLTTNGQLLARKLPLLLEAGIGRINVSLDTLDPSAFRAIARGGDLATVLEGMEQASTAGIRIKVNMVPLRGQNLDQVLPLLDYCLARGYELRFIELMRMGHLAADRNGFIQQFVSLGQLLELIGERHPFLQADAPVDATAVRYRIPGKGHFGVIANESVPFCRTCSRLRLSSTGWLHGCLSSNNRHYVGDLFDKPRHQALPALQRLLIKALDDKQAVAFSGGATVMKIIGG